MTAERTPGMGPREAREIFGRALGYVAPVRGRVATKAVLTFVALLPAVIAPWPLKLLIDQVVLDRPLRDTGYPAFLMPIAQAAASLEPFTLLLAISGLLLVGIFTFGVFGAQGPQRDVTEGNAAGGVDLATRTENDANLGFSLAGGLFGLFDFRFTIRLTHALNHHYRTRLFERIQALPMTSFADSRVGDAIYRIMYDTPAITMLVYEVLLTPFVATCQIALVAWILLSTYPEHGWIGFAAIVLAPLVFATGLPFSGWIRRSGEQSRIAGSFSTSTLEEGMANVVAVQSLGGERQEQARFDRDSGASFGEYRGFVRAIATAVLVISGVVGVLVVWMTRAITDLVIEGALTPGDFVVLAGYFGQIATYAGRLGSVWIRVQGNLAGLRRVFWLMDLEPEDDPGTLVLSRVEHGVSLRGVSFRYPSEGVALPSGEGSVTPRSDGGVALRDVDLELSVGRVTALVGPAGAGKTTLAALIPRFLEPTAGSVWIDSLNARDFSLATLRAQIAFVFQETSLLDATVAENLRLGHPEATQSELEHAVRMAGAEEFVRALPKGFETRLGRGGGKLSVGQRQRLAIARALVRPASILILDEPTSALDPATERALVESLRTAARARAVLVIAHRLGTIREADEIVFLEAGQVRERGTHAELISLAGGRYRHFVELQTRGAA